MPPYRTGFVLNQEDTPCKVCFANPIHPVHLEPLHPAQTLNQNAQLVMDAAISDKTTCRKLLYTGEFLDWAGEQGLREEDVLPPSGVTLCNYAASFAGKLAGGTTKAKLFTVKSWVQRRGLDWKGSVSLWNVLNRVERRAPALSFRDQCPPVKKEHLSVLFNELDLSDTPGIDHAIAAASAGCFYGQLVRPGAQNGSQTNISRMSCT
ncbi:hypothetical protein BT96DRAFT_602044 [Gymnopus androsaceus JB14]|uniref:Uncharacterized protein n=1 Tax=Gymnopus androsaceus JB14 TaxID=1447944 RepID=A0A6A4HQT9_9AGAR|nr:hypothetical protein BT96DRAFT_602044 [Gymnopus androsaceus JB14]